MQQPDTSTIKNKMTNDNKAFNRLQGVITSFQEHCLLAAAAELDFFTLILQHNNQITSRELADIAESNLYGTTILLNALTGLGYLVKRCINCTDSPQQDKERMKNSNVMYSVAEDFKTLLDSRHPETFIHIIRHLSCVQRSWTELARTIKTGQLTAVRPSILGVKQDEISFIMAMDSIALLAVEKNIENLRRAGLLNFHNFIDIGGASGTYALAFLQELPESRGTIFNLDVGIEAAKERFIGSEYESRITLQAGDFMKENLPRGFDFAWVSAIIHQFNYDENLILYKKIFNALESGGIIAIRDFVMNSDKSAPKDGLLFEVNMLAELNSGAVYSFDEIKDSLESVGFKEVEFSVQTETMSSIVIARK